jgi:SRSO17 transposase
MLIVVQNIQHILENGSANFTIGSGDIHKLANVGRKTAIPGQNLQHFISNSPWSGPILIEAIQNDIKVHPAFQEAVLVLDESAEEKAGEQSAGAGRQHIGRLQKRQPN